MLFCPLLFSCGGIKFVGTPTNSALLQFNKKEPLNDQQKKFWHLMDLRNDSIAGMSVERAYQELIKDQKGNAVTVAVIDSGVDIEHSQLSGSLWVNPNEIPNNKLDDDQNGYIDDIHGWNFLGEADLENMESVRLQKKENPGSEAYEVFEKDRLKKLKSKERELQNIEDMIRQFQKSDSVICAILGKEKYTLEEVEDFSPKSFALVESLMFQRFMNENQLTFSKLKVYQKGTQSGIDAHYNIDFDGRAVVGDNPDDINDRGYGNPNVIGPKKDGANHGTHVSGIIVGKRKDDNGNKGVFDFAKIMVLRAVPDGDEYDKDIALAIRYAVDNGAKVINTSFGKGYSPNKEWVWEALKYAEKNDVLIVNAAGNSGENIDLDENVSFVTDEVEGEEIVSNFLTVGAVSSSFNKEQIASFSNFGSKNVDVFAPGDKIWSSTPNENYDYYSGTSMAAPNVSGVAAVIRSFFPKLKAHQVKKILIESGMPLYPSIKKPGSDELVHPKTLSKSGKMVNLYNALIYASNKNYK